MTQTHTNLMGIDPAPPASDGRRRRKLSAIMMADVTGFSALMGADEDATITMITEFHDRVRRRVEQHEGRIVDTAGDSVFSEFDSVVNAVRCARHIQEDQAAANAERTDGHKVLTRIGVHLGDVVVENYHVYGDGVNIAARLEPLADPGGICISEAVYQQIRNKLDLPLEDVGLRELKNIEYPIHLYKVPPPQLLNGDGHPEPATPPTSGAPAASPRPPVAPAPPTPPAGPAPAGPSGVREAAEAFRRELEKEVSGHLKEAGKIAERETKRAAERAGREAKRAAEIAAREARRAARHAAREAKRAAKDAKWHEKWEKGHSKWEEKHANWHEERSQDVDAASRSGVLHKAETAAEKALRSALGEREGAPPRTPETPRAPHEKIDAELRSWLDDVVRTGNLIQLIVGVTLLLSPIILFPTGGVFPTAGAILIAVVLGGVWAKRSGRSGNFLVALGIAIASGAVWTGWSAVTNTLFLLAGLIVATTGVGGRRHRRRRRDG